MKDIDFEELDRAVSSVLGTSAPTSSTAPSQHDTETAHEEVTPVKEQSTTVDVPAAVETPAAPAAKNLVQKRHSGRFMDVVHPSSDMRVAQKPAVSRQGVSMKPVAAEVASDSETASSDETPDVPVMPDPISFDMSTVGESEMKPTLEDTHALDQAASELAELDGIMPDAQEMPPLETPFKSDLAVEKRPLGAFSVEASDTSLLSDEAQAHLSSHDEAAADTPDEEIVIDEEMKRAMDAALAGEDSDSNLVSGSHPDEVESATAKPDKEDNHEETAEADAQVPADTDVVPEELQGDIVAIESRDIETPASAPSVLGVGSIPQQYKETSAKQSEDIVPVFDTTPIKHVEKKKKGWLSIVVILLLIVIGVGSGVAVYYFDPFNLFS